VGNTPLVRRWLGGDGWTGWKREPSTCGCCENLKPPLYRNANRFRQTLLSTGPVIFTDAGIYFIYAPACFRIDISPGRLYPVAAVVA